MALLHGSKGMLSAIDFPSTRFLAPRTPVRELLFWLGLQSESFLCGSNSSRRSLSCGSDFSLRASSVASTPVRGLFPHRLNSVARRYAPYGKCSYVLSSDPPPTCDVQPVTGTPSPSESAPSRRGRDPFATVFRTGTMRATTKMPDPIKKSNRQSSKNVSQPKREMWVCTLFR